MRSTECTPHARILAFGGVIGAPAETVADMAAAAGAKALAAVGLAPADIDLVIVATSTAETVTPNASTIVAARLGMSAPGAFDISHACAGFSYALEAASGAVRAGTCRNALVIGAEKYSRDSDWDDHANDGIFADGAGAAVVGIAAGRPAASGARPAIGPVIWGSDATAADELRVGEDGTDFSRAGQAVTAWVTTLPSVARRACAATGITPADLAALVPHHADLRAVKWIGRAIGAPQARIAADYVSAGNAAATSVPLALTAMTDQGAIPAGAPVLLLEFGARLCFAAQVITAP